MPSNRVNRRYLCLECKIVPALLADISHRTSARRHKRGKDCAPVQGGVNHFTNSPKCSQKCWDPRELHRSIDRTMNNGCQDDGRNKRRTPPLRPKRALQVHRRWLCNIIRNTWRPVHGYVLARSNSSSQKVMLFYNFCEDFIALLISPASPTRHSTDGSAMRDENNYFSPRLFGFD